MFDLSKRTWNQYAWELREYVHQTFPQVHRGCVILPSRDQKRLLAIIFGNEEPGDHSLLSNEVSLIKENLHGMAIQDLGFSRSQKGDSWALISRSEQPICATEAGQLFQVEMLRARAEEAVLKAKQALN